MLVNWKNRKTDTGHRIGEPGELRRQGRRLLEHGVAMGAVLAVLTGAVRATGGAVAAVPGLAGPDGPVLDRLARATGYEGDGLMLVAQSSERLLDGTQMVMLKAMDQRSGEVVRAGFLGDPADSETSTVDAATARANAAAQWRAQHGALTPTTAARLAAMTPDERIDVAVWLRVDLAETLQPPRRPVQERGSTAVAPSANALAREYPAALPGSVNLGEVQLKPSLVRPSDAEAAAKAMQPPQVPDTRAELADTEADKAAHDAMLREQVAAARERFLREVDVQVPEVAARVTEAALGSSLSHTDSGLADSVPLVVLSGLRRDEVAALARLADVNAVDVIPGFAGPSLESAGPTQNADLLADVGYDGSGVPVAVIEGAFPYTNNPYLAIADIFDESRTPLLADQVHPTGVAGVIGSRHPIYRGLAKGATIFAANGDYRNFTLMSAAMSWGQAQASVLNNSWYWDSIDSPVFWTADRQLDYFVRYNRDLVVVAAGNFGDEVCWTGVMSTTYVVSPAKGYNVLSVGNYRDADTLSWDDDRMSMCSSYGNPGAETAGAPHDKPEVVAVGSSITSTLVSTATGDAVGNIGSGTSFSSPMVAALAADMIQAEPELATRPEALKALIMATALRNLEGAATLSDVDGVGGIMPTAALASVERGHWASLPIMSSAAFPITFTQYAHAGERVRFVITWLSNPTGDWAFEPVPPDLDLRVVREGSTLVDSSTSLANTFEIVDFVAPASEVYTFTVSLADSWGYGTSYLGAGWWRGTYRLPPNAGFYDPPASPLGTHLSIHTADWPELNSWRAFGIRPESGDSDLVLSSASWFDDPSMRTKLAVSAFPGTAVDYVVVNGHHDVASGSEHYRVRSTVGEGSVYLNWSDGTPEVIGAPGTYGPYTMGYAEAVKAFDLRFPLNRAQVVVVVPLANGISGEVAPDLGLELFASDYGEPETWSLGRGAGVLAADLYGAGLEPERLLYRYDGSVEDVHGLVVYNNSAVEATFELVIADTGRVWLPLVVR